MGHHIRGSSSLRHAWLVAAAGSLLVLSACVAPPTAEAPQGAQATSPPATSEPPQEQTTLPPTNPTTSPPPTIEPPTPEPPADDDETLLELPVTDPPEGVEVDGDTVRIAASGQYRITGTLAGQLVVASDDQVRLSFDGVDLSHDTEAPLRVEQYAPVVIHLATDTVNTLVSADAPGLSAVGDVFIQGGGDLQVTSERNGVVALGELSLYSGSLQVTGGETGIQTETLGHHGGTLSVTAAMIAVDADEIDTSGGSMSLSGDTAIRAGNLNLVGGTRELTGTTEAVRVNAAEITGGTVTVNGRFHSYQDLRLSGGTQIFNGGLEVDNELTVSGGTLLVHGGPSDPAIRAATIEFGGGTVRVYASGGVPAAQSNGAFTIAGGSGMLLTEAGDPLAAAGDRDLPTHLIAAFDPAPAGTLSIADLEGNPVGDAVDLPGPTGQIVAWGSLTEGEEYVVLVGDTEVARATAE